MKEKMTVIKDSNNFCLFFDFDWPKNVDENFRHGIEFIIKSNESLDKLDKLVAHQNLSIYYTWKSIRK